MNLTTKIILLIEVLMLGTGLGSSLLVSRMMHDALENGLYDQAVIAVQSLAEHVSHTVINGDIVTVRDTVKSMVKHSQNIRYAYVIDFDGRLFAHSFEGGFPKALAAVLHQHTPSATLPTVEYFNTNTGYVVDIAYPLIEGMRAHAHIGMDEEHLLRRIAVLNNWIVILTLLIATLSIVIGIFLGRSVTRPLTELADAMHNFGEHREGRELVFRSSGKEISFLTRAFNRMIFEREKAENELRKRLAYEHLLLTVSSLSIKIDDLNTFQCECLEIMANTLNVDRAYVFKHRHETDTMDNTFEWVAPGGSADKDNLQGVPASESPWWMETLRNHEVINYGNIEEIPNEEERAVLRSQNIKSILVVPLFVTGEYYGFMEFDNCRVQREWPQDDVDILLSASRIVACKIERTQAEEALRQSKEKLRNIIENSTNLFYSQTPDHRLTFLSPQTRQFFDCDHDEAMGIWTHITTDNPINAKGLEITNKAIRTGERPPPYELELIGKKGRRVWVEVNEAPVKSDGKIVAIVGSLTDITERKRAEVEREKLQTQLNQAQKMESMGLLAGGVAHDFNNMLVVILGHTELAMEQIDPGQPLFADLQEVHKAAERSADLTRQLLAFARKQTIAPKVLDLNANIESMLQMLRRLIGENITLAWLPDTSVWQVKVDPSQIDQVLANLCINARDAIEGVGKVAIETGNTTLDEAYCVEHLGFKPGEYVLLAVSDDGCGMKKEILGNLFEPFFTTKEIGTGLGLATVYGIVKQNDGFINVYSEPDGGTTFKIYLPRHKGKVEQMQKGGSAESAARGHETVLLVEDEPSILKLVTTILERQGYTVLAASTPGEAIQLAEEHAGEIHLLMTDVIMPDMNGRELEKNILSLYPTVKCLFMSGYSANIIVHRGVIDEGVNFILKPFAMQNLAAKVRDVLDGD